MNTIVNPIGRFIAALVLLAVLATSGVSTTLAAPNHQNVPTTAFVGVNVIPMDSERVLEDHVVIVRGDRITEIGPRGEIVVPADAQVIDGEGGYLIPGLADMHFHADELGEHLMLAVANGITTVQAFNATPGEIRWQEEIASGERFGPSLIAGPPISGLPANAVFLISRFDAAAAPYVSVRRYYDQFGGEITYEEGRQWATRMAEAGARFLKTNLFLGREAFDGVIDVAEERGLIVQGHVWATTGFEHYVQSGGQVHHMTELAPYLSDSFQGIPIQSYSFELIEERLPRFVQMAVEANMTFTPTVNLMWYADQTYEDLDGLLSTPEMRYVSPARFHGWSNPESNLVFAMLGQDPSNREFTQLFLDSQARVIRELHRAGVPILAGTDTEGPAPGSAIGFTLHLELELLNEYGLSTYETLATATRNAAIFYDELDEWGTVEEGSRADLVLLSANPLVDISNTREIRGVMLRGDWLPQAELQGMLDEVAARYEALTAISLEPFVSAELGFSGVAPVGWNELAPGVYTRSDPESDPTFLAQLAAPIGMRDGFIAETIGEFGAGALGSPVNQLASDALEWTVYAPKTEAGGLSILAAVAETEDSVYLVMLVSAATEVDSLVEVLLLPAVQALTPIG